MKPTVYIETTIVGHLTSRVPKDPIVAGQMLQTRKWWKEESSRFELFTSQIVLNEISRGDPKAAAERMAAIAAVPLLSIPESIWELADELLARGALPARARTDAVHVAIAATNAVQYLLTWNCRHLANADLRARIEEVCRERGHSSLKICTPFELEEVNP
jgi:predicted nucleic acid-binding protein